MHRLYWLGLIVGMVWIAWMALPKTDLLPPGLTWSRRVMDRDGKVLTVTLTDDGRYRLWTPLGELPRDLIDATVVHEDRRFQEHRGIDLRSIARAAWGLCSGARLGGGSTISMQLARLRDRLVTRNLTGKVVQMFRALQLERHYSKEQILEAYLNLAPYGGNIEGAGTAAWIWLGKAPSALTFRECVALCLVPQRPARRSPARSDADPTAGALQCAIIAALRGSSDPGDARYHLTAASGPPHLARHFTRRVLQQSTDAVIETPLDVKCQDLIQDGISTFLDHSRQQGVQNACALLVHAPSREVRAWVGSAAFHDRKISGQVDGVTARRSPGSVLKPFIYALAIRQGLIHPQSLLIDAPAIFSDYNPENFDRGFAGPIVAADALYRSRNLPAIRLLQQLKGPNFYEFLTASGIALSHPANYYGLALALGAEEISMAEIAKLYAMLADDGKARPLRVTTTGRINSKITNVAEDLPASVRFLVRDMLHPREPVPSDESYTAGFPHVSWKTGTSHGWHDAWAAAIAGDYVLVVWVGDFQGRSNPAFTGRRTAGPLLFSLLGALNLPCPVPTPPPELRKVDVCAVSGDLLGPHCGQKVPGWFLPGVSPIHICAVHQEVFLDGDTGLRIASDDGRPGLRREVTEIWPPNLLELFRQAGVPRRGPPPFASARTTLGRGPHIASPQAARTYTLRASDLTRRTIPLQADAAPGVQQLFWFVGKEYLGSTAPTTPWLWTASPGASHLRVIDDQGRSTSCTVNVQLIP